MSVSVCVVRAERGSAIFTPLICFAVFSWKLIWNWKLFCDLCSQPVAALHLPHNTNHFKWEAGMQVWWKQSFLATACSLTCLNASLWQIVVVACLSPVCLTSLCVSGSVFLFFWTGFIRKVYLTLMIQLLVTVGIICAFLYWWDTITRGHSCSKEKRRNVLYCNLLAFNCVIAHQHEAEQVHKVVPAQI